jgi:hypothetical protein
MSRLLDKRQAVWALAACVVAITLAAQCRSLAMPDMAFLLYAAAQVLDGGVLYRDVVEINPPLIIALNLPFAWLAQKTGLSPFLLYRIACAVALGGLLLVSRTLMLRHLALTARERRLAVLGATIALFPLAGEDFGEREQLVLALLLPYLVIAGGRCTGRDPDVLAGMALALKPHFGLSWLATEAFVRLRRRDLRLRLTREAWITIATVGTYLLIVTVLTPSYWAMVAQLGAAYAVYLHDPWYQLLVTGPGMALVLFTLLATIATRGATARAELRWLLATAIVSCVLAGAAQQKGLRYHFFPAFALALVLLLAIAAEARGGAGPLSQRLYSWLSRLVVIAMVAVLLGRTVLVLLGGTPAESRARAEFLELVQLVRERAHGEPVAVLSYHIGSAFPLVNYAGVRLASRFPHWWLFPVSYWDALSGEAPIRYRPPGAMSEPERYFFESVKADLLGMQPRLLLLLRPARDVPMNGLRRLHYIRYLQQDPALASFLGGYGFLAERGGYDLYERSVSGDVPAGTAPSAAPGFQDARYAQVAEFRFGVLDGEMIAGILVALGFALWSAVRQRRAAPQPARPASASS